MMFYYLLEHQRTAREGGKGAGISRGLPGIVLGKIQFSDLGKTYEIFCGIKRATLDFAV